MTLQELKNKILDGSFTESDIKIKEYISLKEKDIVINGIDLDEDNHINGIIDNIIIQDNGYYKLDVVLYELFTMMEILRYYTDVEVEYNFTIEDYDLLLKTRVYDSIKNIIGKDINIFTSLLDKSIEIKLNQLNSFQTIIKNSITQLLEKIPEENKINEIISNFKNLDINSVNNVLRVIK